MCARKEGFWVWVSIKNVQLSRAWPSFWPPMIWKLWKLNPACGRLHSVSGCPVLLALPLMGEWDRCWDWHETFHFPLSEWSNMGTGNSALIRGLLLVRWVQKLMDALRLCFSKLSNTFFRRNALLLGILPIKWVVTLSRGNSFFPTCLPVIPSQRAVYEGLLGFSGELWSGVRRSKTFVCFTDPEPFSLTEQGFQSWDPNAVRFLLYAAQGKALQGIYLLGKNKGYSCMLGVCRGTCQFCGKANPLVWKRDPWKRKAKQKKDLIYPQLAH